MLGTPPLVSGMPDMAVPGMRLSGTSNASMRVSEARGIGLRPPGQRRVQPHYDGGVTPGPKGPPVMPPHGGRQGAEPHSQESSGSPHAPPADWKSQAVRHRCVKSTNIVAAPGTAAPLMGRGEAAEALRRRGASRLSYRRAAMILARQPRSPTLAPLVESLWTYDGQLAHGFERMLPSGRMQLLVNLHEDTFRDYRLDGRLAHKTRGVAIQGAYTAPRVVDTACQRSICGVSFAPASASPYLGMPASELTGKVVDLYEIWGRDGTILRERLLQASTPAARLDVLEAALLARARSSKPRDEVVAVACSLLMGGASVRAVGVRLDLSPRRLIERFQVHVGIKPKLFARIARFQRVLESAGGR